MHGSRSLKSPDVPDHQPDSNLFLVIFLSFHVIHSFLLVVLHPQRDLIIDKLLSFEDLQWWLFLVHGKFFL